ncbi:MAG: cadmium-translocating P-type ATPase, partial [Clostridia bacterium]|nr:cadmium-translocating P-type ATPase [Clostridia bacterium]
GAGSFDVSSLTGESLPVSFECGAEAISGAINLEGEVRIRATKPYGESTVAKILDLVENAATRKAKTENFITKFARYYTPVVVGAALLIGVIPPLFLGGWGDWINRALTFLVVSCPCALVISVPLSFFGGIGGASKRGVLVKGGAALERLAEADTFLFDKTGTITKGAFEVSEVIPAERADEILAAAVIAESASNHPIARSVVRYAPETDRTGYEVREVAGRGVIAVKGESVILVGNDKLLRENGLSFDPIERGGTVLYVAKDGAYLGAIVVSDLPKDNAAEVIADLRADGSRTVMLTGDGEGAARAVAEKVGVDEYRAGLLPQDKVELAERVLAAKKGSKGSVCFVGDGINDAPVLAMVDVGISMGGIGSDAAIEASDIVLMHDDLAAIPEAKKKARRTMRIVRENIVFALGVKVAVLALTALGVTGAFSMWLAVFADVGVAALAILNAMRCLK